METIKTTEDKIIAKKRGNFLLDNGYIEKTTIPESVYRKLPEDEKKDFRKEVYNRYTEYIKMGKTPEFTEEKWQTAINLSNNERLYKMEKHLKNINSILSIWFALLIILAVIGFFMLMNM